MVQQTNWRLRLPGSAGLSGSRSSGAFLAAAERLNRLAQGVKDQQLHDTRSGPKVAQPENSFVASPQEMWARQFMTQSIGPTAPRATFAPVPSYVPLAYPPVARPEAGAEFSGLEPGGRPALAAVPQETARRPGHMIGMTLGKPVKRRSWIGRLLLGG